jgi:patatin-related protein
MKEKELRLALVCYGGVSLVLYMHGVINEILKLSRASKAYHSIEKSAPRDAQSFEAVNGSDGRPHDTEEVYFSLLRSIGQTLNLRVVVDSIAGTSAGGISGVVLARALAHDLSIDHLRDSWLLEADILRLLGSSQRARPWSKWFLRPVLWTLFRLRRLGPAVDREIEDGLSIFFRSRWFEPPFDGDRFLELLLDGLSAMRPRAAAPSSLLPPGHALHIAVSVTDYAGYPRDVKINTPSVITEREHGLIWKFTYRDWSDEPSDLDDGNVAGLALAARATSSFPGAFPPVQLANLERLLAKRGLDWPGRRKFVATSFKEHINAGIDPETASLLDGSIVNGKPFSAVLDMVREHPAYRDVDRRIVYIEPDPKRSMSVPGAGIPSFVRTLEAAILEIPLHEPINRELARLHDFNQTTERMRHVLAAAYPELAGLVSTITERTSTADAHETVGHWRESANALAVKQAGYAFQVYARSKTYSIIDTLVDLACDLGNFERSSATRTTLADAILMWVDRQGALPPEGSLSAADGSRLQQWIGFLRQFDVEFRRRRLSFVMRGLNAIYSRLSESSFPGAKPSHVDDLKSRFQAPLSRLRGSHFGKFASAALQARVAALAARLGVASDGNAEAIAAARTSLDEEVDGVMEQLRRELDLTGMDRSVDAIVAASVAGIPAALRHEVLIYYVGFPFWDVWTFPISEWRAVDEHREIRVDRISPDDAALLRNGASGRLMGADYRHFAGFLSRSRREHDYLWGRLHGAERLIDIVCDAATLEGALGKTDIGALKKAAFRAILDTEEHHLRDKDLVARVRAEVDKL